MIFYRGDSRNPTAIVTAGGFSARQPMTLHEARECVLKYCGAYGSNLNPTDLSRLIISSPQKGFISADPSEDCGGYSNSGYIYRIEFNTLEEKKYEEGILGNLIKMRPSAFHPKLYLNAGSLNFATAIALKHFGNATNEVTFLTNIPIANITGYKKSGTSQFVPM